MTGDTTLPFAFSAAQRKNVSAGCDLPLFPSKTKFDSRTGWPGFRGAA